jgi:hypothetical protein
MSRGSGDAQLDRPLHPGRLDEQRVLRALFGWESVDTGEEMGNCGIRMVNGRAVAGVRPTQPGGDSPPVWTTYVAVDDVEKTAEAVTATMAGDRKRTG